MEWELIDQDPALVTEKGTTEVDMPCTQLEFVCASMQSRYVKFTLHYSLFFRWTAGHALNAKAEAISSPQTQANHRYSIENDMLEALLEQQHATGATLLSIVVQKNANRLWTWAGVNLGLPEDMAEAQTLRNLGAKVRFLQALGGLLEPT